MNVKKLKGERDEVAVQMRTMHETAEKEERGFNADEEGKWNNLDEKLQDLDSRIKRSETVAGLAAGDPVSLRAAGKGPREPANDDQATEETAFRSYLLGGMAGLNEEERQIMLAKRADMSRPELRAFAQGTSNVGGATVPQSFYNQLEIALKAFGGMVSAADMFPTDTGATLPMPSFNYTNVVATIVGEASSSTNDSSTPFTSVNLGAHTYRSPLLPISYEFMQDSAFGEDYIVSALRDSLGRGLNAHATNGTGAGQPRGIVTDSVSGKVGATGQTLSVTYADLVDLQHSIDPAYRRDSSFMFHDTTLKVIRKVLDGQNRPIFVPGYETGTPGGAPDTLLGSPIVINQDMPVMAANAKPILFGALKKYKLRVARDVTILRLTERYADQLQVAFLLFMRADGRLLDAGTNPVKYYQNSAT
jgi:HK97 family phage major capsid protein